MSSLVYKIMPGRSWAEALDQGRFEGAPVDRADGYIHLSTGAQARETARRHFAGQDDLLLVAFDAAALGPALKWEPSRGGDLFPHLYGPLDPALAVSCDSLPVDAEGTHIFPETLR